MKTALENSLANCTQRNGRWVIYTIRGGLAHQEFGGSLDACRDWARAEGFAGLLIGGCSVEWAD